MPRSWQAAAATAAATAATLALAAAGPASATTPAPGGNPGAGESQGQILFGSVGGIIPTPPTGFASMEAAMGRRLAIIRMYADWNTPWPDSTSIWASEGGRRVMLSVKSRLDNGGYVRYRDIAAAQPGSPLYTDILRWANAVKAFRAPVFFTFNHEPEVQVSDGSGTAAEFVAAWRKIITVFRAHRVHNADYLFIATADGFKRTDARRATPYYPGDGYVDDIGADGYNWYTCRPGINNTWRSLADIIYSFRLFGAQHPTKGLYLPEFASTEDAAVPGRKAQWVSDSESLFAQPGYSSFKGVVMFYRPVMRWTCNFRPDSSASAVAAYNHMANLAYYSGSPTPAVPSLPGPRTSVAPALAAQTRTIPAS
jgi:hypothetical protein